MLAVYERIVFLPILASVGHGHLYVFPFQVNHRIEAFPAHVFHQQVIQPPLGIQLMPVENNRKSGIQKDIIFKHGFQVVGNEMIIPENLPVCPESHHRSVRFVCRNYVPFFRNLTPPVLDVFRLSLPESLYNKHLGQGIHSLDTHPVQSDRFFKSLRIVLGSRIHPGRYIHQLAQGNPPPEVTYRHFPVFHRNADFISGTHGKLINRVVHHLFHKNINTVIRCRTVTQFTNIHPRPATDMLPPVEGPYRILRIIFYHFHEFCTKIVKTNEKKS